MKHLDLFSGIGGFALAAQWAGMETIAFCEIEKYPQKVLAKNFPGIPIFNDIRKLHAEDLPASPDVITGGYPCQPFSLAGKRRGEDDDRHLWPEMFRLIKQCKPKWVVSENVVGHVSMGLDQVLFDLEGEGYTGWPFIIPAVAVGGQHRRDRVWIVAHVEGQRLQEDIVRGVSHGEDIKRQGQGRCPNLHRIDWVDLDREIQSENRREVDGVPGWVDRIKGLGNAIVPQVAYEILRCLDC